jgi:hypothetical protein
MLIINLLLDISKYSYKRLASVRDYYVQLAYCVNRLFN